jgi:hypothetical protein
MQLLELPWPPLFRSLLRARLKACMWRPRSSSIKRDWAAEDDLPSLRRGLQNVRRRDCDRLGVNLLCRWKILRCERSRFYARLLSDAQVGREVSGRYRRTGESFAGPNRITGRTRVEAAGSGIEASRPTRNLICGEAIYPRNAFAQRIWTRGRGMLELVVNEFGILSQKIEI